MIQFLKDMFSEASGVSEMRVMAFMVCCTACYLSLSKGPEELPVIVALLGAAFTGKVVQKAVEVKSGDK